MMRTRLSAAVAALLLVSIAIASGCGSDSDSASTAGEGGGADAGGSFPARVEHRFGTTTVPERPERVVVVGLTEQDIVLQLGYKPVAVTEWYGKQPYATWPWARKLLGDSKPEVLKTTDGLEFERIAALRPDLIIGTNAGVTKGDYEKLSKLAPTIPGTKGGTDYFSPWDDQTRLVAAALGKPEKGEAIIEDIEHRYAEAAAEHPEFEGKTATFSQGGFYSGLLYVYQDGLGTDFLTMLGFTINPKLTPLQKRAGEQVTVSAERLDVLESDVMVFATEKPSEVGALMKVPTVPKLDVVRENRAVYTDGTLAGAAYFMTPLSLDYVLEHLTPQLADAAAGKAPRRVVAP